MCLSVCALAMEQPASDNSITSNPLIPTGEIVAQAATGLCLRKEECGFLALCRDYPPEVLRFINTGVCYKAAGFSRDGTVFWVKYIDRATGPCVEFYKTETMQSYTVIHGDYTHVNIASNGTLAWASGVVEGHTCEAWINLSL